MLNDSEIRTLEQILEKDRLQTQLFQELFDKLLNDEYGITEDAFQTLCELADASEMVFDNLNK